MDKAIPHHGTTERTLSTWHATARTSGKEASSPGCLTGPCDLGRRILLVQAGQGRPMRLGSQSTYVVNRRRLAELLVAGAVAQHSTTWAPRS